MSANIQWSIHFTAKDGSEAKITGALKAVEAIEEAFRKAAVRWNEEVGCWDAGFYDSPPKSRKCDPARATERY